MEKSHCRTSAMQSSNSTRYDFQPLHKLDRLQWTQIYNTPCVLCLVPCWTAGKTLGEVIWVCCNTETEQAIEMNRSYESIADSADIMQERKDLAFTLKDTRTIVGKLRTILGIALHFIFIMFYLLIFAVSIHWLCA